MFRKRFLLSSLLIVACLAVNTTAQQRQGQAPLREPRDPLALKEIAPRLYMVGGSGGSSLFRVTDNGIVVVDTKFGGETFHKQFMDLIKLRSNQSVRYAVVTDFHIDHSGNTDFFLKDGVQVVAHENVLKDLETYNPVNYDKPGRPNVTYSRDYSIRLGNAEAAHVYHFGNGHTNADSIIHFPDLGVVAVGDVLMVPRAVCSYEMGGSIPGWAQVIEEILKLKFDQVVPGHLGDDIPWGTVPRDALVSLKVKLDSITRNAIELVRKGTPKDQLLAKIEAADPNATVRVILQNNPARIDLFYEEIVKLAK